MRQFAELENQMISVERVMEYANLKPEPPLITEPKYKPYTGWPDKGRVAFKGVNLRYTEDGDLILKDLNDGMMSQYIYCPLSRPSPMNYRKENKYLSCLPRVVIKECSPV